MLTNHPTCPLYRYLETVDGVNENSAETLTPLVRVFSHLDPRKRAAWWRVRKRKCICRKMKRSWRLGRSTLASSPQVTRLLPPRPRVNRPPISMPT